MSYLRYLCLFGLSLPPVVCMMAHVLFTIFVFFAHSDLQHILCCGFCFVYLRLVCPLLPVSLYCPFLIAPSVSLTFI